VSASFPDRFSFWELSGPRAKHFDKPTDAFQQLVGDGLKAMVGHSAMVSPARGGQDGSIDALIEPGCQLIEPFNGLELPAIIECKQHSDHSSSVSRNVNNEWKKVSEKLTKHAALGWRGNFGPWRTAGSYVYCISALLPNPADRRLLAEKIKRFFDELPMDQRPSLKSIRVLDWSDLRPWLESLPAVLDAWMGLEFSAVVDHQTAAQRLTGFKTFLLNSNLKFVPPSQDDPWHPARLLKQLQARQNPPGIILVGVGGVGKTRTCFEVAQMAADENWRVLHVDPGEPAVTVEDLASVILPQPAKTLLVFDYLDQMQYLDLGGLRRRLIPQLKERGGEVRVLANCRPSWLRAPGPERDQLFAPVRIQLGRSQNRKIAKAIVESVATTACRQIGAAEVMRLCGERPIIALLIACELERRALHNELQKSDFETLRTGDLTHWLRRRLTEDHLVARDEHSLLSRPAPPVVAAAAALACAPGPVEALSRASQSSLESLHYDRPEESKRLVGLLLELGWLEQQGRKVTTAHDVVADEVLEQVLVDDNTVRESELDAVLAVTSRVPRSVGRFALALRRVIGAIASDDSAMRLQIASVHWLKRNATVLGEALSSGDPDTTGFALGQVLAGPPWSDVSIEMWESLIEPWLTNHGHQEEARHLIYKGLRGSSSRSSPRLIKAAFDWLAINGIKISASFVIAPLLDQEDLEANQAREAINHALRWLAKDNHGERLDAHFVLRPLLAQKHLAAKEAQDAINYALRWLDKDNQWEWLDAHFVLPPLLAQKHLAAEEAQEAVEYALRWLEKDNQWEGLDARFVLPPLLAQMHLAPKEAQEAIEYALGWLEKDNQWERLGARFVLRPLLAQKHLAAKEAQEAIEYALRWLEKDNQWERLDAQFVLGPLLEQDHLEGNKAREAIDYALRWLGKDNHSERTCADFVLKRLCYRSGLLVTANLEKLANYTLRWLKICGPGTDLKWMPGTLRKLRRAFSRTDHFHEEISVAIESILVITEPEGVSFRALVKRLKAAALGSTSYEYNANLLEEGCAAIQWGTALSPGLIASAIPALLVIANRAGDEALKRVKDLTRPILNDERLTASERKGVAAACTRLLDANAFPSRKIAAELFRELGIGADISGSRAP
jgi:hypothetical protein